MKSKIILATTLTLLSSLAGNASAHDAKSKTSKATHVYFHKQVSKIGVPVTVELISNDQTNKNITLPLTLQFTADQPNLPIKIEYTTDKGLTRTTPVGTSNLVTDQNGVVSDIANVRANNDGVYNLNVFVTVNDRTGAVSIPITVGNAVRIVKPAGKQTKTANGESLMILPAQETVK